MSDIVIRNMEMPTRCGKCDLRTYRMSVECDMVAVCSRLKREIPTFNLGEERMFDCPLVELPPHGELVDRNFIITNGLSLRDAPTVLEATE